MYMASCFGSLIFYILNFFVNKSTLMVIYYQYLGKQQAYCSYLDCIFCKQNIVIRLILIHEIAYIQNANIYIYIYMK